MLPISPCSPLYANHISSLDNNVNMFNLNTFILRLGAQFGSNDRNIKIEQMLPVEHEKFRVGYTHIVK